jgi:hypothetical protein
MTHAYSPVLLNHLEQRGSPWYGTDQEHWQQQNKTSVDEQYQQNLSSTTFTGKREEG